MGVNGPGGDDGGMATEVVRRIAEAVAAEDGPTVVALLADPEAPEASWRQAGRLCDAVAERRRTLVVNLAGAGSGFDGFLGVDAGDGLEGVRSGRIKLSEAPVQVEGRRFLYLPAGRPDPASREEATAGEAPSGAAAGEEASSGEDAAPGAASGPPLADAAVVGAVEKLAGKIREADGALLLYLTPDTLPDRRATDLMDGAVRLAGAVGVGGVRTLGRLDVGRGGPDGTVEDFLGLPTEPEGEGAPAEHGETASASEPGPAPRDEEPAPDATAGEMPPSDAATEAPADEPTEAPDDASAPGPPERDEPAAPARPTAEAGEAPGEPESTAAGDREPVRVDREATRDPAAAELRAPAEEPPEERPAARVVSVSGDEDGEEGDGGGSAWRRHRRRAGIPWGRVLLAAALVVGLAAGWWYLAERATPDAAGDGAPAAGERAVAATEAGSDGAAASTGDDGAPADAGGGTASGEAADGPALVERSPELSHSVLVASYASWSAARERLDRWSAEDGAPLLFAAPTPVGGRVYWRVFAGALADREEAVALNRRLVDRGWKEEATAWEVRTVSLAFLISVLGDGEAAGERVSDLRARDLPAYGLPAAAEGDTAWAVWAGAYESPESASDLGRRLRQAGVEAELVTRRGAAGGP